MRLRKTLYWGLILVLMLGGASGSIRRAAAQDNVLLQDDFKDNANKWGVGSDSNGTVEVADGALTIKTSVPNWFQWSFPEPTLPADVDATVTAQAVDPDKANDWYYGLGVRGRPVGQALGFYYLYLTGNGDWFFEVTADGNKYTGLTRGKLNGFQPDAATTLRIVAAGNHFDLYINNGKVGAVDDSSLEKLDANLVALASGNYEKTSTQLVKFTALKVVKPGTEATPEPTGEPTASSGLPFSEDFKDSANPNGWNLFSDDSGSAAIADGALTIETIKAGQTLWTYPARNLPTDVDVSVVGQAVEPDTSGDWSFGIGVRGRELTDTTGFYYFTLWGNGYWDFGTHPKANTYNKLVEGTFKDFKVDQPVTLRIVAAGNHFDLYINDGKVGQADDSSLEPVESNLVLLLGGTGPKTAKQAVTFTDMKVVAP